MQQYLDMIDYVLSNGSRQVNRTGVATISSFAYFYKVNLAEGYPLITTKKMYFNSMLREMFWYLSGEAHVRNLSKHTKIWDAWADNEGKLETAYGRFWRRYPVPESGHIDGENWGKKWISRDSETAGLVFDQIQFIMDTLREIKINPSTSNRRRMIVSAWHPGNAAESKLPPCHYTYAFSVSGNKLNCHLTQRSGDIALGIPFNLACYSLLTTLLARETGYEPGEFAHTIIDAHIYENHIDGLKEQLKREIRPLPRLEIEDKPLAEMQFEDVKLHDYNPHPVIKFDVAI